MAPRKMYDQPTAGPSTTRQPQGDIPKIGGSIPGVLDPTQGARLCRHPSSKLSFAAFDPHTASPQHEVPDLRKLSLNEELYRPKRVVIETATSGESFWRFVPSARRDEGVSGEGKWPRVVEICGMPFECSQDQWDIYKLDPLYDCYVRTYPNLTVISRNTVNPNAVPSAGFGPKRPALSPTPTPDRKTRPPNARKKVHGMQLESSSDDGEESEVEEMIVDDGVKFTRPRSTGPRDRARRFKDEIERNRKARREKLTRRAERITEEEKFRQDRSSDSGPSVPSPPESAGKRKVNSLFDSLRSNGDSDPDHTRPADEYLRNTMNYVPTKRAKRTRTVSPTSAKRDLEAKRLERERQKKERWEQELQARRQQRESQFLREVYNEIPDLPMPDDSQGTQEMEGANNEENEEYDQPPDDPVDDEGAAREAAIAESRRKLAELEADRPLWEAEAAKRKEKELTDEMVRRAKAEAQKRAAAHQAQQAARQREEAERKVREEAAQKEAENKDRREREKRQRQSWMYGRWSQQRALERYMELSKSFDETKFTLQEPLAADAVPWPVLQSPSSFTVEDVTWQAVEQFFDAFKPKMRTQDFKMLVEKSQRRFHPDRWRSRSLLASVADEVERECMEIAANTVAQALTPMWQQLKATSRS